MPSVEATWLVAGAAVVLWVLPGPALLLLATRGVDLGARGALATALGLGLGTFVHVVAATVGLSAVLAASANAYTAMKVLGGLYLIWLGVQRWRDPTPLLGEPDRAGRVHGRRRAFVEGFTINALNPKVAVFFVAFLPPFVDPSAGAVWSQFLVLGTVVVLVLLAGDAAFAAVTGSLGRALVQRLSTRRRERSTGRWLVGGVYVALGVGVLATGRRPMT